MVTFGSEVENRVCSGKTSSLVISFTKTSRSPVLKMTVSSSSTPRECTVTTPSNHPRSHFLNCLLLSHFLNCQTIINIINIIIPHVISERRPISLPVLRTRPALPKYLSSSIVNSCMPVRSSPKVHVCLVPKANTIQYAIRIIQPVRLLPADLHNRWSRNKNTHSSIKSNIR